MAKKIRINVVTTVGVNRHFKTSIGNSYHSRPLNKHKRRSTKRYRGQGK